MISWEDYLISGPVSLHPSIGPFAKMKLHPETKDTTFVYVKLYDLSQHIICVEEIIYSLYDTHLKTAHINWRKKKIMSLSDIPHKLSRSQKG